MNRRKLLLSGLIAPLVPAAVSIAETDPLQNALDVLAALPQDHAVKMFTLSMALRPGHQQREYALSLLDAGLSPLEVERLVIDRVMGTPVRGAV